MTNPFSELVDDAALKLAILFHETYERLAPSFGYETRAETKTFDPSTPNGKLMVAVCAEILAIARVETEAAQDRLMHQMSDHEWNPTLYAAQVEEEKKDNK